LSALVSRSHALRGNGLPRRFASQIRTQSVHEVRSDAKSQLENKLPCGSDRFKRLEWLGFVSLAAEEAVFYLDGVELDLAAVEEPDG